MANQKSAYREKVERVLERNAGQMLSRAQIISMSGIDAVRVDYVISKLLQVGLKHIRQGNNHFYIMPEKGPTAGPPRFVKEGKFTGVDWSYSTMRPGCLDHEKHGSRRGDTVVPFKTPASILTDELKDKTRNARD